MKDLLIHDISDELFEHLRKNAENEGVIIEEKVKSVLNSDFRAHSVLDLLEQAKQIRERNAHLQKTNTLDLLHEGRNER